jgi:hypothetical protein
MLIHKLFAETAKPLQVVNAEFMKTHCLIYGCSSMVECLPSMCKDLGLKFSTSGKKKQLKKLIISNNFEDKTLRDSGQSEVLIFCCSVPSAFQKESTFFPLTT